ncbi:MAG: hypothetical protein QOF09_5144 [Alphaproteobacteria bacterium]|jgi:predicted small lipoprotein YifL|nr:hypothetical protein [Alphaproteobacteria bacterium]
MSRGVRWFVIGFAVLVTLAGCGRGIFQYAEREPWRREAEVACLNSGTVKEGAGLVRISPIDGPGMCGADFPLKVSALGEGSALGYVDEPVRPPGSIPGASRPQPQPRWPIAQQQYSAPPAEPRYAPPQIGAPMSIEAPGVAQDYPRQQILGAPPSNLQAPPDWQRSGGQPDYNSGSSRRSAAPAAEEIETEELPPYSRPGAAPGRVPQSARPVPQPLPPLGPPQAFAAPPVEVKPAATLACPIVSALDRWFAHAVQPAARKWFNQPVVEIKQISAYSCRGMNGQPGASISEHAFGNALDIAAFVLADGHRITVKDGWKGSPEEQGFLRDVQGSACDQFTTVLAPGSNQFHYDHIHVDLMRRASGRRICQPGAVDGEVVASRARVNSRFASRPIEPPPTRRYDPPVEPESDPFAWRGDARRDPGVTGSIAARRPGIKDPAAEDLDWVEESGPRPAIDWSSNRHKIY